MRRKETSTDRKLLASQYNNYLIRDKYTEIRTVKLELQYKFKRQLNMAKFKVSHQFSFNQKVLPQTSMQHNYCLIIRFIGVVLRSFP